EGIGGKQVGVQVAGCQPDGDLARAVVLATGEAGFGGTVGVEQVEVEVETALDGRQRRGAVPVFVDKEKRAVVDGVVDAHAAFDKGPFGVDVDPLGQVGFHDLGYVQVRE